MFLGLSLRLGASSGGGVGIPSTPVTISLSRTSIRQSEGVFVAMTSEALTDLATAWETDSETLIRRGEWYWTSGDSAPPYAALASHADWRLGSASTDGRGPWWAHEYPEVGTYTPTLMLYWNGRVALSDGSATVTVTSEDAAFPGSATAYWSPVGEFADAPSGAVQIGPGTGDIASQLSAVNAHLTAANRRALLRGGETFALPGQLAATKYGGVIGGDVSGGKSRPIITAAESRILRAPGIEATLTGDGTTTVFALSPALVALAGGQSWRVYLDNVGVTTGFTISGSPPNEITFDAAPGDGVIVRIARDPMVGDGDAIGRMIAVDTPAGDFPALAGRTVVRDVNIIGDYNPARPKTPDTADLMTFERGGVMDGIQLLKPLSDVTITRVNLSGLAQGVKSANTFGTGFTTKRLIVSGCDVSNWSNFGSFCELLEDTMWVGCRVRQNSAAVRSGAQYGYQQQNSPQVARHGPFRWQGHIRCGFDRVEMRSYNGWGSTTTQPAARLFQSGDARGQSISIQRVEATGGFALSPQNGDTIMDGTAALAVIDRVIFTRNRHGASIADSLACTSARNILYLIADDPADTTMRVASGNIIQPWVLADDLGASVTIDHLTVVGAGAARSLTLASETTLWAGGWKNVASTNGDRTALADTLGPYEFVAANTWSSAKPVVYVGPSVDGPMTAYRDGEGVTIEGSRTSSWTVTFDGQPTPGHVIRIAYTQLQTDGVTLYPNPLPALTIPAPTIRNRAVHFLRSGWTFTPVAGGATETAATLENVGDFGQPLAGSALLGAASGGIAPRGDLLGRVRPASRALGAFEVGADVSAWPAIPLAPTVTIGFSATPTNGNEFGVDVSPVVTISAAGAPAITTADIWLVLTVNNFEIAHWRADTATPSYTFVGDTSAELSAYFGHPATGRVEPEAVSVLVETGAWTPAALFTPGVEGVWLNPRNYGSLSRYPAGTLVAGDGVGGWSASAGDSMSPWTGASETGQNGLTYQTSPQPYLTLGTGLVALRAAPRVMGPDWTVAMLVRPNAIGAIQVLLNADWGTRVFQFRILADGKFAALGFSSGGGSNASAVSAASLVAETTHRVIASRVGNTIRCWLDGVLATNSSLGSANSGTVSNGAGIGPQLGEFQIGQSRFTGRIADVVVLANTGITDITDLDGFLNDLGALA